jgi:ABC-type uncharacterized transport system permease subunit
MKWRNLAETLFITVAAIVLSMVLFGVFIAVYNQKSPVDLYRWMYVGGFGTRLAWERALTEAAPLILTALCTALPARLGLIVIGGEGALAAGGLASVSVGLALGGMPALSVQIAMIAAGMLAGGLTIVLAGALSHWRGVNATISSLLIAYIVIAVFKFAVEGPMRDLEDPDSLNTPSTKKLAEDLWIGKIPGLGVHWGLLYGVVFAVFSYILMYHTTFGFAAQMAGGNVRAAQASGLPVGRLVVITCMLGGAAAGLAGMIEIAADAHQANANLFSGNGFAGYGFTGILVSFIARHHPLGILPVAVLFGALDGCSGTLQQKMQISDASVKVLMGTIFVLILSFETLYGRFRVFQPAEVREAMAR